MRVVCMCARGKKGSKEKEEGEGWKRSKNTQTQEQLEQPTHLEAIAVHQTPSLRGSGLLRLREADLVPNRTGRLAPSPHRNGIVSVLCRSDREDRVLGKLRKREGEGERALAHG